jgi:tRNA A-37 threonylcarbamoyl transferase component Bud32
MTSTLQVGQELAEYRIESLVARGGFSTVYLAEHLRLRRRVALKVLAPELAADERFRERFLRESQIAASLDHPNIVPIYDAGESEALLFIAMRYVEGTDLGRLVAGGPLDRARALDLLEQVAEALDTAHLAELVHRDVKPSNVLIQTVGGHEHCYLADFGISKRVSSATGLTGTGEFIGTISCMAPEQIEGRPTDGRADVYSFGCVLHECLTGSPVFTRDTDAAVLWAHVHDSPPPTGIAKLDPVLARALAKRPEDRFSTCAELIAAAREALAPPTAIPIPKPRPAPARARRLPTILRRPRQSRARDAEWRVRQLLPIAPPALRPHLLVLENTAFTSARTARDVDRYLARYEPKALRRHLAELRKTAMTDTGARAADSAARQLAAVEKLVEVRGRLAEALASLDQAIDELRTAVFQARSGTLAVEAVCALADESAARIQDPADEADAFYQQAVAEAALEGGEKLRRTLHRGVYRQGSSYVVPYYDEQGRPGTRAFETLEGARVFRRSLRAARAARATEPDSAQVQAMDAHTRERLGKHG